ncbi:Beta-barrel assembly machine subunit BamA [Lishizhenia tianjinensis]|uniref:Outer membrane protein assembly factor BamA n=1 Tax=Lishizhenia tianjinensis TaxID=477690 RepID=A0A1I7A2X5_9FLAO|nr:outer membrane protein assembly factor BamA [Lishizhenia tianjinensis]SFT69227.1 Beta-barrel assembly machine subunit BamA [Lishizhenia tianjinensis]
MHKLVTLLFTLAVVFTSFGQDIDYKNPKEYEIGPVNVLGADNFDHTAIKLIAGLRQGDKITIPGDDISNAIKKLWNEGLFSNVEIVKEKVIGDVIYLSIILQPRAKLSRFKFNGVTKKEADKIREEIDLFSGKNITENLIFQTENKVEHFFKDKGYYLVKANIVRKVDTLMSNSEIFIINVDKGEKMKIAELNIVGVETVKEAKLRRAMKDTKQKAFWRFFKRSKFMDVAYKRDKLALTNKLQEEGLRDAEIVSDSVYIIDEKHLGVDIKIDEGEKYYFGNITWVGNAKYRTGYLDTVLGIKYGDVYNKTLLEQRLFQSMESRDITSLYMDRGHLFFQIIPIEKGVVDNHINYELRIIEGKEATIGDIFIKGNFKTNEHVIRRELRMKPGDLFNRNDIIRTQRELMQLGYFDQEKMDFIPIPNPQDGTVDIEVVVNEKSSDQIELSGGYGANTLILTAGLSFNNFSVQNFFDKSAWSPLPTGDGQRLSLRAQTNGMFYQAYSFSFTEPWLGGKKPNALSFWMNNNSYSLSGNLSRADKDYQGISITGLGVGLQRRKKIPDDYFTAYYELGYKYYDVRNYNLLAISNGYSNNIYAQYVLSRNSIDAPIYPRSGSRLTFTAKASLPYSMFDGVDDYSSYSQQDLVKFNEFYKLKMTGEWYLPLTTDKKLVLAPRFGIGFMGAYSQSKGLSPFDRFSLGGSGLTGGVNAQVNGTEIISLRGYGTTSTVVSSTIADPMIAKYSVELRYPISLNPSAMFWVYGFAEAGNTYTALDRFNPFNVKRSVGLGLNVNIPMIGMLGFSYGWGLDALDPHSDGYRKGNDILRANGQMPGVFQFTIGTNIGDL